MNPPLLEDLKNRFVRSWFSLNREEHRIILVILGLFLLGLAVRTWHLHSRNAEPREGQVRGVANQASSHHTDDSTQH